MSKLGCHGKVNVSLHVTTTLKMFPDKRLVWRFVGASNALLL